MNAESFKDTRETVQRLAVDAFKDHVLTAEGDGRWLCKRPGTGCYHFRLITAPCAVMVIGDLGEFVIRISDRDPLPWLRGAINSPDYLISKVQASKEPRDEFYPVECIRWLRDNGRGDVMTKRERTRWAGIIREARRAYHYGELHEHEWFRLAAEHAIDDAHHIGRYPTSSMQWLVELCKCFIRLHDAEKATAAA